MKVLLLSSAYNSMCQRIHRELGLLGFDLSIELSSDPMVMREHRDRFSPDIIVAPFLKHRIPNDIWLHTICLVVHPGVYGDGGPSSLDWAILNKEKVWGVTLLQANQNLDGGKVWCSRNFTMRSSNKSNIYRREVMAIASKMVKESVLFFQKNHTAKPYTPQSIDTSKVGWKPYMKQSIRKIDWQLDSADTIVTKINCADSSPGVLGEIGGIDCYFYGAFSDKKTRQTVQPGKILGHRAEAIQVACKDGTIWIKQLKLANNYDNDKERAFKLPAIRALANSKIELNLPPITSKRKREIHAKVSGEIGYLYFDCYNGALNTEQCINFLAEYRQLTQDSTIKVIVLMGGEEFWCNGIHLNCIENSPEPNKESWRNINAINLIAEAVITTTDKITVAALRNNAGAGGAILALGCDYVIARDGIVLNPHYQLMGLPGSEFSTYTLPKRVGDIRAKKLLNDCLPLLASEALDIELVDRVFSENWNGYHRQLNSFCRELANREDFSNLLTQKTQARHEDEVVKPILSYASAELKKMKQIFDDTNSSYHLLRYRFVHKIAERQTPSRLVSRDEKIYYHEQLARISS